VNVLNWKRGARVAVWLLAVALVVATLGCGRKTAPTAPAQAGGDARVVWLDNYENALTQAQAEKKPLMVDVMADWCSACKRLDAEVFSRADVAAAAGKFVAVKVDGDKRPELKKRFEVSGYPTIILLTPEGKELGRVRGAVPYQVMKSALEEAARPGSGS
jgi:thiol:disulfide interchange protein